MFDSAATSDVCVCKLFSSFEVSLVFQTTERILSVNCCGSSAFIHPKQLYFCLAHFLCRLMVVIAKAASVCVSARGCVFILKRMFKKNNINDIRLTKIPFYVTNIAWNYIFFSSTQITQTYIQMNDFTSPQVGHFKTIQANFLFFRCCCFIFLQLQGILTKLKRFVIKQYLTLDSMLIMNDPFIFLNQWEKTKELWILCLNGKWKFTEKYTLLWPPYLLLTIQYDCFSLMVNFPFQIYISFEVWTFNDTAPSIWSNQRTRLINRTIVWENWPTWKK